ncbi:lymphocyte antigen 75-like protein [Labeo rohita]|uniref:Lymphocyte antigen 75-like protein n=1 Tax=Labeo rohita TaxID=84645 RepID=A0A498MJB7_LABRO|nr:lymphocyte antigen 75-like protein [Labeo rohita]
MVMKATVTIFLFLSLFGLNSSLYRKHYYVNDRMKWSDAQQYCRNHYDDLSTIRNEELQPLSANPQIFYFYWIGLRGSLSTRWTWTSDEVATNVMWDAGEPDSYSQYCCAVTVSSSKVQNADCDWPLPFYCMEVFELILVQQEHTWEEAMNYCKQNYKDLAILNSDEMMTEAKVKSTAALTDDVWIGLRFIAGYWVWVNGENLRYKGWSSGGELQCPAMNQRCAVLNRNSRVWKPVGCEQRFSFLCINR